VAGTPGLEAVRDPDALEGVEADPPRIGGSRTSTNNERDPNSPLSLGDEIVFHDQLFSRGKQVGDSVGSCVIAAITPETVANCSVVFRLPGGNITAQFVAIPGPTPRDVAVTGARLQAPLAGLDLGH
jgi:hypothetical protein